MELANMAFNIGRSVAVAAKNLQMKRSVNSNKYIRLKDETGCVVDGKPDLLEKFLRDAIVGTPVCRQFNNNPFRTQELFETSPSTTESELSLYYCNSPDTHEASFDLLNTSSEFLSVRTPGDGAETPTSSVRRADGDSFPTPVTRMCSRRSGFKSTTRRKRNGLVHAYKDTETATKVRRILCTDNFTTNVVQENGNSSSGATCIVNRNGTIKTTCRNRATNSKQTPLTCGQKSNKDFPQNVPSLNTAFLQSESCTAEGTFLLMDSVISRGGSEMCSYVEDSNELDQGFINYGIV